MLTTNQESGPLGDEDGAAVLTSVQAIEPNIQHALVEIVTKKPAFQGEIYLCRFLILMELNPKPSPSVDFPL